MKKVNMEVSRGRYLDSYPININKIQWKESPDASAPAIHRNFDTNTNEIRARHIGGYGLLEIMIVLAVVSLLAALAMPAFNGMVDRARVERAIGEIGALHVKLEEFRLRNNDQLPASLAALGVDILIDPWGQPYEYLRIQNGGPGKGGLRKDGKLNPLNTDYDLYSKGADGASAGPLSAKASRDDIVRANNGAFIGLGEDY